MYWADTLLSKAQETYKERLVTGKRLVIRDEKTASGRVHVGSLRGVAIHGIVAQVCQEQGVPHTYLFEINDYDPMDGLPVYLDEKTFLPHMGKPLCNVPSPDGKAKNYAEYFGQEFAEVIKEIGFKPEYYRSSDLYKAGKYNDAIRRALDKAPVIRAIYKKVSGATKEETWLPINVICEKCGKVSTTRAKNWDGTAVEYECGNFVDFAKGCGHKGTIEPWNGNAKLPWKVEWAAKFTILDVSIEGGGKDHSTRGGSREVADTISREVFDREPPLNIPYEFFNVGGKKMSSSKGRGSSSREIADLLPPHILRFLLIHKEPQRVIEFDPEGDTVPLLFDMYDTYAKNYFAGNKDDFARVFELVHEGDFSTGRETHLLPRFSNIAYLVQMPHVNMYTEIEKLENKSLEEKDKMEIDTRAEYARRWLSIYAPENFKFEIQKTLPTATSLFSPLQKQALSLVATFFKEHTDADGQAVHTALHEIKTKLAIEPKVFFEAIYLSILDRKNGPKAGWFLSVLDKEFLIQRFEEASR